MKGEGLVFYVLPNKDLTQSFGFIISSREFDDKHPSVSQVDTYAVWSLLLDMRFNVVFQLLRVTLSS